MMRTIEVDGETVEILEPGDLETWLAKVTWRIVIAAFGIVLGMVVTGATWAATIRADVSQHGRDIESLQQHGSQPLQRLSGEMQVLNARLQATNEKLELFSRQLERAPMATYPSAGGRR